MCICKIKTTFVKYEFKWTLRSLSSMAELTGSPYSVSSHTLICLLSMLFVCDLFVLTTDHKYHETAVCSRHSLKLCIRSSALSR